jgi:hypothetical protein
VPRTAFAQPAHHPYFELLASSVPELRRGWLDEVGASRMQALPPLGAAARGPELCSFLDRCPLRISGACDTTAPPQRQLDGGIEILCHRSARNSSCCSRSGRVRLPPASTPEVRAWRAPFPKRRTRCTSNPKSSIASIRTVRRARRRRRVAQRPFYPIDFRSPVPFTALHDNVSMYVDEIWKDAPQLRRDAVAGAVPNTYIDTNRHELDIDPT